MPCATTAPDVGRSVWIYRNGGVMAATREQDHYQVLGGARLFDHNKDVTYWMPREIPQPPRGEGDMGGTQERIDAVMNNKEIDAVIRGEIGDMPAIDTASMGRLAWRCRMLSAREDGLTVPEYNRMCAERRGEMP